LTASAFVHYSAAVRAEYLLLSFGNLSSTAVSLIVICSGGMVSNTTPAQIRQRYRPPLKTNTLAGLQLLVRFRGTDFARRCTTLLARWWEKLCRAVHFIFGSLAGEKLWDSLIHFFRRSTGFVYPALTLPARLLRLV